MPLAFLIDGYNLIHALGLVHKQIAPKELETARRRLLDFLHERLEPRAAAITVIFDARRRPPHVSVIVDLPVLEARGHRGLVADVRAEAAHGPDLGHLRIGRKGGGCVRLGERLSQGNLVVRVGTGRQAMAVRDEVGGAAR